MTFSQFLIYVVAAYLIYYLVLITYDLLIRKGKSATEPSENLVYKEDENIQVIEDHTDMINEKENIEEETPEEHININKHENIEETKKDVAEPAAGSHNISGGVGMQELMALYRNNALALTAQVFNK